METKTIPITEYLKMLDNPWDNQWDSLIKDVSDDKGWPDGRIYKLACIEKIDNEGVVFRPMNNTDLFENRDQRLAFTNTTDGETFSGITTEQILTMLIIRHNDIEYRNYFAINEQLIEHLMSALSLIESSISTLYERGLLGEASQ